METATDVATIVGLVRDIVLLLLLAVVLVTFLIVFGKVTGLLNTANRMARKAEDIIDTVSEKVVQPATSNPRGLRILARTIGFLAGLARGRERKGE